MGDGFFTCQHLRCMQNCSWKVNYLGFGTLGQKEHSMWDILHELHINSSSTLCLEQNIHKWKSSNCYQRILLFEIDTVARAHKTRAAETCGLGRLVRQEPKLMGAIKSGRKWLNSKMCNFSELPTARIRIIKQRIQWQRQPKRTSYSPKCYFSLVGQVTVTWHSSDGRADNNCTNELY